MKQGNKTDVGIKSAMLLILVFMGCFVMVYWQIDRTMSNSCYNTMEEELLHFVNDIQKNLEDSGGDTDPSVFQTGYTGYGYSGKAREILIDKTTGDILLDTQGEGLGNLHDSGMEDHPANVVLNGSVKQLLKGQEGRSPLVRLQYEGQDYDACYMSVGNDGLVAMLVVPEQIAFAEIFQCRKILNYMICVECFVIVIYFLWMLARQQKKSREKEEQIKRMSHINEIQQILFGAHNKPELLKLAMQKEAQVLTADAVFLLALDNGFVMELHFWSERNPDRKLEISRRNIADQLPQIVDRLSKGESVILYKWELAQGMGQKDSETLSKFLIDSLMMVPILGADGELNGILGSINMKKRWTNAELLECSGVNMLLALNNVNSYRLIREMGTMDALTGVRNRNFYQMELAEHTYEKRNSACCIYLDANGLHELNNHLGHKAGDEMLICIGTSLVELFGCEDVYRIGGDEFIVFCIDTPEEVVNRRVKEFLDKMEERSYAVSVGVAWREKNRDVNAMIQEAERRMYESKNLYYSQGKAEGKKREMDRRLEEILQEKRDIDNFLAVCAVYFRGICIVDLNTDEIRSLYSPPHVEEEMEKHGNRHRYAIRGYMEDYVHQEDRKEFEKCMDYRALDRILREGNHASFFFRKKDGMKMVLRIYPSKEYAAEHKETIWMFEPCVS